MAAEVPEAERTGADPLLPDHDVCLVRLGDVARSALVLHHLRHDLPLRAGAFGALVHGSDLHPAFEVRANDMVLQERHHARYREADAGVYDVLGVRLILAVPDHLGGQSSGRDQLVSDAARPWLA